MKKFYRFIIMAAIILIVAPSLISCEDETEEANEYTTTYIYLQRNNYLDPDNVFTIKHSSFTGLSGDVSMVFKLKAQRPAPADITVNLNVIGSEGLEAERVELSSKQVIIKAGETQTDEVTASIPDLSFMAGIEDAVSYTFDVSIESLQSAGKDVEISKVYHALPVTINKEVLSVDNIESGEPANSQPMNRTGWVITLMDGVEGIAGNLVDGKTTDVAMNNSGFWVAVDLGAEKTVTGLNTSHWAASYAPKKIAVYVSDDGVKWKSMGQSDVSGSSQKIMFKTLVRTRYLKYDILAYPSRVDITEFNIYEPKATQ